MNIKEERCFVLLYLTIGVWKDKITTEMFLEYYERISQNVTANYSLNIMTK